MDIYVTKITVHTGVPTEWEVHVHRPSKIGGKEEAAVRSADIPHGPFLNELAALRAHFVYMLEAPHDWGQGFQVTRIDIDRKENPPFYKLTAERYLQGFDKPIRITAPPAQFTGEALECLRRVEKHALDYANGKRAQMSLFESADEQKSKRSKKAPAKQPPIRRGRRPFANA